MTDTTSVQDKIVKLKEKYINSLSDKVNNINHEWSLCKASKMMKNSEFISLLHKLAGSAGMYELFELGEKARTIELSVIDTEDAITNETIIEIDTQLKQLRAMVADLG
jgi:HPt (histidine-containing phosphotransfer) domain-containing protein